MKRLRESDSSQNQRLSIRQTPENLTSQPRHMEEGMWGWTGGFLYVLRDAKSDLARRMALNYDTWPRDLAIGVCATLKR